MYLLRPLSQRAECRNYACTAGTPSELVLLLQNRTIHGYLASSPACSTCLGTTNDSGRSAGRAGTRHNRIHPVRREENTTSRPSGVQAKPTYIPVVIRQPARLATGDRDDIDVGRLALHGRTPRSARRVRPPHPDLRGSCRLGMSAAASPRWQGR